MHLFSLFIWTEPAIYLWFKVGSIFVSSWKHNFECQRCCQTLNKDSNSKQMWTHSEVVLETPDVGIVNLVDSCLLLLFSTKLKMSVNWKSCVSCSVWGAASLGIICGPCCNCFHASQLSSILSVFVCLKGKAEIWCFTHLWVAVVRMHFTKVCFSFQPY